MATTSETVCDVEYQTGAWTWKQGPKESTLYQVSSLAEARGYQGFKATCEDGIAYWFVQLADGWNYMRWNG